MKKHDINQVLLCDVLLKEKIDGCIIRDELDIVGTLDMLVLSN